MVEKVETQSLWVLDMRVQSLNPIAQQHRKKGETHIPTHILKQIKGPIV